MRPPRFLIVGGGSGGHATPALAIAEALSARWPESRFLFLGTQRGAEARMVPSAGFELQSISVIGLKRQLHPDLVRFPFALALGCLEAVASASVFDPDLTVCTGGFVSGPAGIAASLVGCPMVLHDSNHLPGLTVRVLSHFAERTFLGQQVAKRKVGGRIRKPVGNPIRKPPMQVDKDEARRRLGLAEATATLLITGGSLGSRAINRGVEAALPALRKLHLQVLWQSGSIDEAWVAEVVASWEGRVKAVPFIDEMPLAYRAADLAVTRSGAITLTELSLYGVPAILIPLPTASEGHQEVNARAMERAGAARMLLQRDLDGPSLGKLVETLLGDRQTLEKMSQASRGQTTLDAAQRIVEDLAELVELRVRRCGKRR